METLKAMEQRSVFLDQVYSPVSVCVGWVEEETGQADMWGTSTTATGAGTEIGTEEIENREKMTDVRGRVDRYWGGGRVGVRRVTCE